MSANNNNNNQPPSTLSSLASGVAGTLQEGYAKLTGSTTDTIQAEQRKQAAHNEYAASHDSAKLGPVNASSSGAVTVDNENRTQGKSDQTIGSGKEFLGGLIGSESMKQEGARQHQEGVALEKQGQAQDLVGGMKDRATGAVGAGLSKLTGNTQAQAAYQQQHDVGKTNQRTTEAELDKEAEAERQARLKESGNTTTTTTGNAGTTTNY